MNMADKEILNFYESLTNYYKGKYEKEETKSKKLFDLIMAYQKFIDVKSRKSMLEELLSISQNESIFGNSENTTDIK